MQKHAVKLCGPSRLPTVHFTFQMTGGTQSKLAMNIIPPATREADHSLSTS
jgi:hypothetical protein